MFFCICSKLIRWKLSSLDSKTKKKLNTYYYYFDIQRRKKCQQTNHDHLVSANQIYIYIYTQLKSVNTITFNIID